MAYHQRQYSTLSNLIIQLGIKINKHTINCLIVMAMVGLMLSLPELVRAQAPPAKPFLRHLTAILTASWPEKEIFLLHQCTFLHVCISFVLMPIVVILAVLLDDDTDSNLSEQDSMNEIYLHWKTWPTNGWRVLPSQRCGEISYRIRLTNRVYSWTRQVIPQMIYTDLAGHLRGAMMMSILNQYISMIEWWIILLCSIYG